MHALNQLKQRKKDYILTTTILVENVVPLSDI